MNNPIFKWGKRFEQTEEYTGIANEHMKRYSVLLVIKEMQIKTTKGNHFTPTRMTS